MTGAVGVLSALAAEIYMKSFGLLGKLTLAGTDPLASKALLIKIAELFGLDIDMDNLEEAIEEAQEKNDRITSLAREVLEQSDDDKGKGPAYYI